MLSYTFYNETMVEIVPHLQRDQCSFHFSVLSLYTLLNIYAR